VSVAPASPVDTRPARVVPASTRLTQVIANVVGALGAGYFAWSGYHYWRASHSLIGVGFLSEQLWVVVVYLARRRATHVSSRADDWLLAFVGTFAGVLFRPTGSHPQWGVEAGFVLQASGLAICAASFVSLGRSFGFAAANRGVKCSGPYSFVRHPLYGAYVLLQLGYVLQSISLRNVAVMVLASSCNVGRLLAEERLLGESPSYRRYIARTRWRLLPGVW
jgi:protein-S-isoprenylcysteine O-methyltransferase Ste14